MLLETTNKQITKLSWFSIDVFVNFEDPQLAEIARHRKKVAQTVVGNQWRKFFLTRVHRGKLVSAGSSCAKTSDVRFRSLKCVFWVLVNFVWGRLSRPGQERVTKADLFSCHSEVLPLWTWIIGAIWSATFVAPGYWVYVSKESTGSAGHSSMIFYYSFFRF